jgi:peptide/nickel transport system substrate-binding protein
MKVSADDLPGTAPTVTPGLLAKFFIMTSSTPFTLNRRDAVRLSLAGATALASPVLLAQNKPSALQIVGPWDIGGLAPASSGFIFTRMQIAETLLGAGDDGVPQAALAQRWTASVDGLTWRFDLRPSARFHDGTPVTAAAVATSLKAARIAPAVLSLAPVKAIEADGAGTVVIRLSAPFSVLPGLLAHSSTLVLAPASYAADGSVRSIIGSGPYRVTSLSPPQQLEAAAFEGFDGPKPAIGQVRYLAVGRSETRALMAESGQTDLAYGLDPASLQRLGKNRKLRIETITLPRTVILKLNAALPSLKDVRVRRALSLAIDRAGIAKALLRDPGLAATQLFPPTLKGWHDPALPPLAYDPAAAKRLLAEAGWKPAADGLRDAQGQPLQLSLRTFPDRPELPVIATALQAQWRQAGIAVQVSIGNAGDIPLGHRDGSLQLGLGARNYANIPDPAATLAQDFSPQGGDWGAMGWSSAVLDTALAELMRGNLAPERQAVLRARISQVLQAELPVIPVSWYHQQVAASQRISGVSLDPLERSYRLNVMQWRT